MKQDIRITKTLGLIRHVFLELLEEKGFEHIVVQDILDRAQINRSTFYKHFQNKHAVALMLVDEIKQLLTENFENRFSIPTTEFAQKMVPIFWQHRDLIHLIGKIENPRIHLYKDLALVIKEEYIKQAVREQPQNSEELDFQGYLFAIVSLGTIRYFVEKGELPDPSVIVGDIESVFNLLIIK
ncbi:TetR/AcrR family transcriptional regulator [Basfia succiniciproducens]|uniref:TetR/AcrR family transcriptional regulator n=1 Tax=Basfia succiniciproducens TaxID=653940 RepID=UPI0008C8E8EC|nr:TetR/AcrR family transcriptional regulator [Basfia succiniciproducens]SEQ33188.1 transcriptional regulator, TetR family [Basfia succiniciproducens]